MENNELRKYFENNRGRLIHKWQSYFDVYEKHFSRYRDKEVNILEIGINQGGTLQMWKHYFGDRAKVFGVDIDCRCKEFEEEGVSVYIGSQEDRNFLRRLIRTLPRIDILIDDGGHTMRQQIITFEELFPRLAPDGIYLCEDVHTSYWEKYQGGREKAGTFIELTKKLIDQLNGWRIEEREGPGVTSFTRRAKSLHFYESIIVIELGKVERPRAKKTGKRAYRFKNKAELGRAMENCLSGWDAAVGSPLQLFRLGNLYTEQGEFAKAIEMFREGLRLDPSPHGHYCLAVAQQRSGDPNAALGSYGKALELDRERPFCVDRAAVRRVMRRLGGAPGAVLSSAGFQTAEPNEGVKV